MTNDITLYKNIKKRRLQLGLTQSELAEKLGYADKSAIAKIEKGLVDLPQSKIKAFADVLETTPAEIMGWIPWPEAFSGGMGDLSKHFELNYPEPTENKSKSDKDPHENDDLNYLIEIAQDCNENSMHRLLEYAKRLLDLQKMDEENRSND